MPKSISDEARKRQRALLLKKLNIRLKDRGDLSTLSTVQYCAAIRMYLQQILRDRMQESGMPSEQAFQKYRQFFQENYLDLDFFYPILTLRCEYRGLTQEEAYHHALKRMSIDLNQEKVVSKQYADALENLTRASWKQPSEKLPSYLLYGSWLHAFIRVDIPVLGVHSAFSPKLPYRMYCTFKDPFVINSETFKSLVERLYAKDFVGEVKIPKSLMELLTKENAFVVYAPDPKTLKMAHAEMTAFCKEQNFNVGFGYGETINKMSYHEALSHDLATGASLQKFAELAQKSENLRVFVEGAGATSSISIPKAEEIRGFVLATLAEEFQRSPKILTTQSSIKFCRTINAWLEGILPQFVRLPDVSEETLRKDYLGLDFFYSILVSRREYFGLTREEAYLTAFQKNFKGTTLQNESEKYTKALDALVQKNPKIFHYSEGKKWVFGRVCDSAKPLNCRMYCIFEKPFVLTAETVEQLASGLRGNGFEGQFKISRYLRALLTRRDAFVLYTRVDHVVENFRKAQEIIRAIFEGKGGKLLFEYGIDDPDVGVSYNEILAHWLTAPEELESRLSSLEAIIKDIQEGIKITGGESILPGLDPPSHLLI